MGRLLESIQETLDDVEDVPQRFLAGSRDVKNKCYVLITSSNGLCGSFNGNVIRTMTERLSEYGNDYSNVRMVTIGSKGREYFAPRFQRKRLPSRRRIPGRMYRLACRRTARGAAPYRRLLQKSGKNALSLSSLPSKGYASGSLYVQREEKLKNYARAEISARAQAFA